MDIKFDSELVYSDNSKCIGTQVKTYRYKCINIYINVQANVQVKKILHVSVCH